MKKLMIFSLGAAVSVSLTTIAYSYQGTAGYCKDKDTCTGTDVLCKGCVGEDGKGGFNAPNPANQITHLKGTDCDMTDPNVNDKICKEDGTKTKCKKTQPCNTVGLINNAECPAAGNACETEHPGKKCKPVVIGIATYDPEQDNKKCQAPPASP